jgi:capsular polysaccharide transport system ATP-binding protein
MRARLAFGLSLAIDFECYLVDEVLSVGDRSFRQKSKEAFKSKFENNSFMILVSHSMNTIREYCDCGIIIKKDSIDYFDSIETLISNY